MTSHAALEDVAFRLFVAQGFDATTLDDIAAEAGVARRTVTRYFRSKNDIPWGQFETTLDEFRRTLASGDPDQPLWQSVQEAVVSFNSFPAEVDEHHRVRMRLILRTPTLQAHSNLKYAAWRAVIAEHVAARTGAEPAALGPATVAHVSLALAIAAYEQWLDSDTSLPAVLAAAMGELRHYLRP